jgi:3-oxoacyl-ACP reductase-like protein
MGLFSTLMSKVFGHAKPAPAPQAAPAPEAAPAPVAEATPAPEAAAPAPEIAAAPVAAPVEMATLPADNVVAAAEAPEVDVTAILDDLNKHSKEKGLDWKKSIVDLMKLVGMESSLHNRQELAKELGYTGDLHDSAKMNVWLHKEVIKRFADNGGKVPADLLD